VEFVSIYTFAILFLTCEVPRKIAGLAYPFNGNSSALVLAIENKTNRSQTFVFNERIACPIFVVSLGLLVSTTVRNRDSRFDFEITSKGFELWEIWG